jgi:hypothetical protein
MFGTPQRYISIMIILAEVCMRYGGNLFVTSLAAGELTERSQNWGCFFNDGG